MTTTLPVELEIEGSTDRAVSIPSRFEVVRIGKSEKNGFSRRTPRFKRPKNELPGPGEYETLSVSPLVKNTKSLSEKGYGNLCSSNPRFHGFSRRNFNPPGPGHYSLPTFIDGALRKNKNRVHGNSGFVPPKTTSLHFYKTRSTPGPGQYDPNSLFRNSTGVGMSTSSFRSGTRRPFDPEKKKKEKEVNPVMGRKPKLKVGEKGSRFQSWEMSTVQGVQKDEKKRLIRRMKRKKKGIVYSDQRLPQSVFRSKSKRGNYASKSRAKVPGPGAYEYDPKKRLKRGNKIGTRRSRGRRGGGGGHGHSSVGVGGVGLKTSQFEFPGSASSPDSYIKPSSCFASNGRLDRFGRSYLTKLRKKRPTPGPGSYYPNYFEEERKKMGLNSSVLHEKGSSMFSSRSKRFFGSKRQTKKGPACYDPLVQAKKQFHLNYQKVWI